MEEILRWGTQDLFQARKDSEDAHTARHSGDQNSASPTAADIGSRDGFANVDLTKESKVVHAAAGRLSKVR